jgi:hypothetical protein
VEGLSHLSVFLFAGPGVLTPLALPIGLFLTAKYYIYRARTHVKVSIPHRRVEIRTTTGCFKPTSLPVVGTLTADFGEYKLTRNGHTSLSQVEWWITKTGTEYKEKLFCTQPIPPNALDLNDEYDARISRLDNVANALISIGAFRGEPTPRSNPLHRDVEAPRNNGVELPPFRGGRSTMDDFPLLRDAFPIGSPVEVAGSKSCRSQLYGKKGMVTGITEKDSSADRGWVFVFLKHGEGIKVRPEDLKVLSTGSNAHLSGFNSHTNRSPPPPIINVTATVVNEQPGAESNPILAAVVASSEFASGNDVPTWDTRMVAAFVRGLGSSYSSYGDAFLEAGIDGAMLMTIEEAELPELIRSAGVANKLHELRIKKEFRDLKLGKKPSFVPKSTAL